MANKEEIKELQVKQKKNLIELEKCRHRMELIRARHTKIIWEDAKYDIYKTGKSILQNADLIINLAEDVEYQKLLDRFIELDVDRQCDDLINDVLIDERL